MVRDVACMYLCDQCSRRPWSRPHLTHLRLLPAACGKTKGDLRALADDLRAFFGFAGEALRGRTRPVLLGLRANEAFRLLRAFFDFALRWRGGADGVAPSFASVSASVGFLARLRALFLAALFGALFFAALFFARFFGL